MKEAKRARFSLKYVSDLRWSFFAASARHQATALSARRLAPCNNGDKTRISIPDAVPRMRPGLTDRDTC